MSEPYTIDPSWPVREAPELNEFDYSEVDECGVCHCRDGVVLGERGGVETWLCGVCA